MALPIPGVEAARKEYGAKYAFSYEEMPKARRSSCLCGHTA